MFKVRSMFNAALAILVGATVVSTTARNGSHPKPTWHGVLHRRSAANGGVIDWSTLRDGSVPSGDRSRRRQLVLRLGRRQALKAIKAGRRGHA